MTKAKFVGALAIPAALLGIILTVGNSNSGIISADSPTQVWGHSKNVAPTIDTDGASEYWVNCLTGEIRFEEPEVGVINELPKPTEDMIQGFASFNDGRYVPKLRHDTRSYVIAFGEYPQSKVTDEDLISNLNTITADENNCVRYDGARYEKVVNDYYKYEPIDWRVLDNSNPSSMLVCADFMIDSLDHYGDDTNYLTSNLRSFINTTFYQKAFGQSGSIILPSYLPDYDIVEKVYALDYGFYSEIGNWNRGGYPQYYNLSCPATDYAKRNGNIDCHEDDNGCGDFFLRSAYNDSSVYVATYDSRKMYVDPTSYAACVRPAMRICTDANNSNNARGTSPSIDSTDSTIIKFGRYPKTKETSPAALMPLNSTTQFMTGGICNFGSDYYEKFNSNYYKYEPLTWKIVDDSDISSVLIVCTEIIDTAGFGSTNAYSTSDLRRFLNTSFISTAFSGMESHMIVTNLTDVGTNDFVYAPSYDELGSYKTATATDYSLAHGLDNTDGISNYWARTASGSDSVNCITTTGTLTSKVYNESGIGLRPCMRIDLSNSRFY